MSIITPLARAAALAGLLPALGLAQDDVQRCSGPLQAVTGVSLSGQRVSTVDFNGSGGQLGPLLDTEVMVRGRGPSCLLVHVSALAVPNDNHIVFQLLVDGVPAPGQSPFPTQPGVPVFYDPEESDQNNGRSVAQSFVVPVQPGLRRVELRFAGCCSAVADNSGVVNAATLTVQHR